MSDQKIGGVWTALGTLVVLTVISYKEGLFGNIFRELGMFFTGDVGQIPKGSTTLLSMIAIILVIVAIKIPLAIILIKAQNAIMGESGEHELTDIFAKLGYGAHFQKFFIAVTLEEILARGIFLGLLTMIPFLSGPIMFYVLFFLGNGIWAAIHLPNFKEEKDRQILRVLPQFIGGIFYTYIFWKFGLLASILAHFASNAVLFSLYKVQDTTLRTVLGTLYAALCAVVSYLLMSKNPADALLWVQNQPQFALPGWIFWDYVLLSVFFSSSLKVLLDVLLYDHANKRRIDQPTKGGGGVIDTVVAMLFVYGITYALFAGLGWFIADIPYRILLISILWSFVHKSESGSAMARTFWASIPNAFMAICLFQVLGILPAIGCALIQLVINAPKQLIEDV